MSVGSGRTANDLAGYGMGILGRREFARIGVAAAATAAAMASAGSALAQGQVGASTRTLGLEIWQDGLIQALTTKADGYAVVMLERAPFTIRLPREIWKHAGGDFPALRIVATDDLALLDMLRQDAAYTNADAFAGGGYAEPAGGHDILYTLQGLEAGMPVTHNYLVEERFNASDAASMGRFVADIRDLGRDENLIDGADRVYLMLYMEQTGGPNTIDPGDVEYIELVFTDHVS